MTEQEKQRFERICLEERDAPERQTEGGSGIGTYGEKRLHRVLKRWLCDDPQKQEVAVGRHVADLLVENEIMEIQTKNLRALSEKLKSYLEDTEYRVTVIYPMIVERRIVRMDRETGEVISVRKSPKKAKWIDALSELYWLREVLTDPRVSVRLLLITAEERRYSERVRYRREGVYEGELIPETLSDEWLLSTPTDYEAFLPKGQDSFTAAEYGVFSKQKGRHLYSCLNLLCAMGLLQREKEGRQYRYWITNKKDG